MKKLIWMPFLTVWGLCIAQPSAHAQEYKQHIEKQFDHVAAGNVVAVYNLFGFIKVEGTTGNQVTMSVDETIHAESNQDLDAAKKEFKLGFDQKSDSVIAYTAYPYDTRPRNHYHRDNDEGPHYHVVLEYTIRVPNNVNLRVSTVNDGFIDIKNVNGALKVNNVNGAISIANARGTTEARTINGNLTVNYASIPPEASSYYTLNGKLEVSYPAAFTGDLQFKSMNGQFYTDFPNTEVLPVQIVKTEDKKAGGTTYKLEKNTRIRIGSGGKLFKFETLNGNIYIKKQS